MSLDIAQVRTTHRNRMRLVRNLALQGVRHHPAPRGEIVALSTMRMTSPYGVSGIRAAIPAATFPEEDAMSTSDEMLERAGTFGPIQIWTFAFDGNQFKGEILPELDRLKDAEVIRLIDLLVVRKDGAGRVATLTATDLDWEEATSFGAMIGGLIGFGVSGEEGAEVGAMAGAVELAGGHAFGESTRQELVAVLPPNSTSAIALVEHLWAKPLKAAIARAEGTEVDNDWLKLDELVALGLRSRLRQGDPDGAGESPE
jgi:uncharacterized membrane protein